MFADFIFQRASYPRYGDTARILSIYRTNATSSSKDSLVDMSEFKYNKKCRKSKQIVQFTTTKKTVIPPIDKVIQKSALKRSRPVYIVRSFAIPSKRLQAAHREPVFFQKQRSFTTALGMMQTPDHGNPLKNLITVEDYKQSVWKFTVLFPTPYQLSLGGAQVAKS